MRNVTFLVFVSIGFLLPIHGSFAQEIKPVNTRTTPPNPPVNLEAVFGHEGMAYQLMINKKLQAVPRLGFFSITSLLSSWEKGPYDGIMSQGLLTYRLLKGLDAVAGFHYTDVTGARPSAGVIYSYATPAFLLVANPRIDLVENAISETMVFAEYKPKLNDHWRLYSRVQGLYGFSTDSGDHARSYLLTRLGATTKEFTFGLAANFDWFGPFKGYQENFGVFVTVPLF